MSNRKNDTILEKALQPFFDGVYDFLKIKYKRNYNADEDIAGCDLRFFGKDKDNTAFIIDEKCATDFYYKDLHTFCMELSAVSQDKNKQYKRYKGWFVDPNKNTEYYALSYVRADSKEDIKRKNIHSFETIIVSKEKITDYILQTARKTLPKVKEISDIEDIFTQRIRCGAVYTQKYEGDYPKGNKVVKYISDGNYRWRFTKNLKVVWSIQKDESPICICVNKDILSKLSCYHTKMVFNKDGEVVVTRIK